MKELKGDKMKNFDISVFKTLYDINENTINKIKKSIYSKIDILDKDGKLNLLLIGPGYGRLEIPLIQLLLEKNKKLDIIAVDPSNEALCDFKKELEKVISSCKCKITNQFEEFERESKNNNNQIVLLLLNKKIEKCIEDSNNIFQENKYHIITAFFVMQNVSRLFSVVEKIILSLKVNGFLLFGEEQGYCKFVDGLFEPGENFDNDIVLLKVFHEYRNTLHKPWEFHPVKASDHSIFSNILKDVGFSKEIDQTIEIENLPYIKPKQLFKVFTPFQAWLTEEEKNNGLKEVNKVGKVKSNNTRIEKIRFLIFKKTEKLSEEEFKKIGIKNSLNDYIYKNLYSLILLPFSLNDFLSSMKPPDFRSQNYENLIKLRLYFLGELFYNFFSDKVHLDYILYFHDFYLPEKSKYLYGLPVLLMFGDEDNLYLLSYSLYFYVKKILNIETFIEYLWKNYPDYAKIEVIKGNTFNVEEILFENSSLKGLKITLPEFNEEDKIKSCAKEIFNCIKNQYKMKDIFYPFEEFINPISSLSNQNQEFEKEVKNIYNNWIKELHNNQTKYEENFYKHLFSFYFIGILSEFPKWKKITFYNNFIFLQNPPRGFSSLMKITFDTEDKIEDELEDIFMKNLWSRFGAFDALYGSFYNVRSQVLSHALRSAVAAIMARNMSHNIGSHILARVDINEYNERLASLSADLRIKIFNEIFEEFHKYLQQKSDFLAEVSTEPTRPFIPGYFFRDVILPFDQQIIVKEFIGRNEGITNFEQIKIDLTIKDKNNNDKNIFVSSYKCEALGGGHQGCAAGFYKICLQPGCGKKVVPEKIENLGEDVLIELPGTLGKFAIYNILEGFIRNSCKHNSEEIRERINKNLSPVLTVHLEVREAPDGENYICEIWDDISLVNKVGGKNLVDTMKEKFKSPLIDTTGNLNRENWGSAEFKICAALLKDIEFMEMNEDYTKCIEVIEKKGYLGYRFYLKKYLKGISIGRKWEDWLKKV
jgi:hypothetical protein